MTRPARAPAPSPARMTAALGLLMVRATPRQVKDGSALRWIRAALEARR